MIHIIDSIMSSGKTQAAINYINSSSDDMHFVYITPYLDEVERIINECKNKNFQQPLNNNGKTPKLCVLKKLLSKGQNIVTTHALFQYFDDEVIKLCHSQGYVLIMDEVASVIEPYIGLLDQKDRQVFLSTYVDIMEDGILKWKDSESEYGKNANAKYSNEKRLCDMKSLAAYGKDIILWLFPIKVFKAFRESYILTYMFNSQVQRYYYDYYGLKYEYMYVTGDKCDNYHFTSSIEQNNKQKTNYKELIHILQDEKLNSIGRGVSALSKSWYAKNYDTPQMKKLKNNTENFFRNKLIVDNGTGKKIRSKTENNIWTTFKDYKQDIKGKGYTKGFVPSNARATNQYKDRTAVAYLVNKFLNPYIKNFFTAYNITVDEDGYALSEMLQFIWRSAIREGNEITVYIPSARMRRLLEKWIDENSNPTELSN